jgi:hypothetical protein
MHYSRKERKTDTMIERFLPEFSLSLAERGRMTRLSFRTSAATRNLSHRIDFIGVNNVACTLPGDYECVLDMLHYWLNSRPRDSDDIETGVPLMQFFLL